MRSRQERLSNETPFRRILYSRTLLVVEVLLLVFVSVALGKEVMTRYAVQREIRELQEQYEQLERANVEIGSVISYLESDSFAEEEARSKLGLKKEGESVIILPGTSQPSGAQNSQTAVNTSPDGSGSNTTRWWQYFFGSTNT